WSQGYVEFVFEDNDSDPLIYGSFPESKCLTVFTSPSRLDMEGLLDNCTDLRDLGPLGQLPSYWVQRTPQLERLNKVELITHYPRHWISSDGTHLCPSKDDPNLKCDRFPFEIVS